MLYDKNREPLKGIVSQVVSCLSWWHNRLTAANLIIFFGKQ